MILIYVQQRKPDTKEYILYDYVYIKFKKLNYGIWDCIFRW